jgi:hypothetical protein
VIPRDAGDHGYLALEVDGRGSIWCDGRGFWLFGGGRGGVRGRLRGRLRDRGSLVGGGCRGDGEGEALGVLGGRAVLWRLVFGFVVVFGFVLVFRGRLVVDRQFSLGGRLVLGGGRGEFQAHGRHRVL